MQRLLLRALRLAGVREVSLDIGHVAVFRALLRRGRVAPGLESDLHRAMQAKDVSGIGALAKGLDRTTRAALAELPGLYGGIEVLARARRVLPPLPEIRVALRELSALSRRLADQARIRSFDLGELRGYHYHSGVVFSAYSNGRPNAIAHGGRYDEVGKAFGRARPATGFSIELRELAAAGGSIPAPTRVLAPCRPADRLLQQRIAALRGRGLVVVEELPGHARSRRELGCTRELVRRNGRWVLREISK